MAFLLKYPYECNAGVLNFNNSNDISIENSELYGCGSICISLNSVKRLTESNCKIDHCSLKAIDISNSEAIKFTNNKIVNHEAFSNIVAVCNAKEVTFEKCEFADNNNFSWSFLEAADNSNVLLDKCIIRNNTKSTIQGYDKDNKYFFKTTDYLGNSNSIITVRDSEISNQ
ncbi:right-handed parallel beta-helix repeat-containing protein [Clostridium saccharoperbutylacetonicum]|uniref:right-handed parallel beta-helix repeat-containing protein n=1 Tax=Clostridium saccharoperbutylacetonicum TaxID=36745 RepID=UPI0039EC40E2